MTINQTTRLNQVKNALLHYISQNQLERNDQLPAEATIAKTLGVSRNTLREAYISLENDGVIIRRHGIGTFIAHNPVIQDSLNDFFPFAQIIQQGGYTPNFKTLSMEMVIPSTDVAERLRINTELPVRCIKRLVLADKKPVIYVEDYLAPFTEAEKIDWNKFDGNMVDFLSEVLSIQLYQIQSSIRAASLDKKTSACLELPEGFPVLSVRSTIYGIDNSVINYSKIRFNSDIVELNTIRTITKK